MTRTSKGTLAIALVSFLLAAVIVSPLLYCLSASFMTEKELYASQLLPSALTLNNYRAALRVAPIFTFILNSTIVALACTAAQLLTGSLAGFVFALQNTRMVAVSGLIVGISATFSMASSEFLSARSEGRGDALKSCTYTGIAYLITVVLLIAPYLIFDNSHYILALICMLAVVVLIIAGFTYYTSVAMDQAFKSRFLEMAAISIGVAVLSFVVGVLAKQFLGVDV